MPKIALKINVIFGIDPVLLENSVDVGFGILRFLKKSCPASSEAEHERERETYRLTEREREREESVEMVALKKRKDWRIYWTVCFSILLPNAVKQMMR